VADWQRTRRCGELCREEVGQPVTVNGWVAKRRDLGGLIFIDLRDSTGLVQLVFDPANGGKLMEQAQALRNEYVISAKGKVGARPGETVNRDLATGEVEIRVDSLEILNASRVPPLQVIDDLKAEESTRLRYRYLDLRRPRMQHNLLLRHRAAKAVRDFLDSEGFLEVETPSLIRSTPEGARDYLVPSRVHPGSFYALPQSPQLFKQLLMASGIDRYFQLARCYRDEDLRADRQPEFTQIDLEMAFVERDDVLSLVERLVSRVLSGVIGVEVPVPFPRITHREAMERYGIDKPDLRFRMPITDVSDLFSGVDFQIISSALERGERIRGITVPGQAEASRKTLDNWASLVKPLGLPGLFPLAFLPAGQIKSTLAKYLDRERFEALKQRFEAQDGDLVLLAAGPAEVVSTALGSLRLALGGDLGLVDEKAFRPIWVVDFPLFKWNQEEGRLEAEHHPFTSPLPEDLHLLDTEPDRVRAGAYDLVLNGNELGSGSIRIHRRELQEKVLALMGQSLESARQRFGFLLEAFEYGAPPHGGVALGFDRLVAMMAGESSIREVLAFPKNQNAACPLTGAPVPADEDQLAILGITVSEAESDKA